MIRRTPISKYKARPTDLRELHMNALGVNPFGWQMMSPLLLPALAALLAPLDVLTRFPALQALVEFFVSLLPGMLKSAAATRFPEVWLLTQSLALSVILPGALWAMWRQHKAWNKTIELAPERLTRYSLWFHFKLLLGVPIILALLGALLLIPGDPSFAKGMTTHSRFGLALMTVLGTWCVTLAIAAQYNNLKFFYYFYLRR